MSITSKVLAAAAMLAVAGGLSVAGTLPAAAATPQCGPHCIQIFSAKFGRFKRSAISGGDTERPGSSRAQLTRGRDRLRDVTNPQDRRDTCLT